MMLVGCPCRMRFMLRRSPGCGRCLPSVMTLVERDRLVVELSARVLELSARVTQLEARVSKNSQNSSKPPSSDAFVKPPPRSLCRSSGRQSGEQPGGQGFALKPRPEPDEVVWSTPRGVPVLW